MNEDIVRLLSETRDLLLASDAAYSRLKASHAALIAVLDRVLYSEHEASYALDEKEFDEANTVLQEAKGLQDAIDQQ